MRPSTRTSYPERVAAWNDADPQRRLGRVLRALGAAGLAASCFGCDMLPDHERHTPPIAKARARAAEAAPIEPTCRRPLPEFCAAEPCPKYDRALADAKRKREPLGPCRAAQAPDLEAGRCGALRYVRSLGHLGGDTEYFDGAGTLVGAARTSDYAEFCNGTHSSAEFGSAPACERKPFLTLCERVECQELQRFVKPDGTVGYRKPAGCTP